LVRDPAGPPTTRDFGAEGIAWRQDAVVDIEELYGLPLERFVPERNALARELRAAERRDEADAVAALRKPSVAARAVNRLAREHRRQLSQLFTAGDALSEMQSRVLAGKADGRALSEAAERERAAVSALVDVARTVLAAEGLAVSSSVLERVGETLHAAALDDEAREPVEEGRLERELRHIGLGMGPGADVATPPKTRPTKGQPTKGQPAKGQPAKGRPAKGEPAKSKASEKAEARKQAEAEERAETEKRAQARKQAEATEQDARREAAQAAEKLDDAERAHSRAAEALEQAKATLTAARRGAKAAETAHRRAERELRRLES
jgi:hypothetical protein